MALTKVSYAMINGDPVNVLDYGAVGDGVADDTAAIQAACAASTAVFFPKGSYLINLVEGNNLALYTSTNNITITGDNATIIDNKVYTQGNLDVFTTIFSFVTCTNVHISGINYSGVKRNITNSSQGATFVNLSTQCENIFIDAFISGARYGVRAGDYDLQNEGYSKNITTKLSIDNLGYGVAYYLSEDVNVDIYATDTHRAVYAAGVQRGEIQASFLNSSFNAAAVQVLITDSKTGTNTSRGSANLKVIATDRGTTSFTTSSYCAAISLQRVDPNTIYSDIDFHVYMIGTNTVNTTVALFGIFSSVTAVLPVYPFNWEQSIYLNNISVSGMCDRSNQTLAGPNSGNIVVETLDGVLGTTTHYATVSNFSVKDYTYFGGSTPQATINHQFSLPGLTDIASFYNCNFSVNRTFLYASNNTSRTLFENCVMQGTWPEFRAGTDNNTVATLSDCTIGNAGYVIQANKTIFNSSLDGAIMRPKSRVIYSTSLSGASFALSSILAGSVVLGVSGIVTSTITGATSFQVGVLGDLTRYADSIGTATGTVFSAVTNSTLTTPLNYPSTTNFVITATGGNFTGGTIKLIVHYFDFANFTS
jgi:hypothetical protein